MAVVLDFQVGGQPYRVARGRRRNGATQVQLEKLSAAGPVPVADKVETVGVEVARLLGLGFDAFTQAALLPQGQFAAFLKSEPRDRRKMLNGLLRLRVYERMRDLAGARESAHESRKAALERRLREDFEGVTAEAVAHLQGRQEELREEADESGRRLEEAQQRLAAVRRDHDKTHELSAKEQELAGLEECQPAIAAMGRQLEAALRASVVIPWLDQADRARHEQQRRAGELALTRKDQAALEERHRLAQDALAGARRTLAELPGLRDRQEKLAEVLGKLPHREQLDRQCAALRDALELHREKRGRQQVRREELSQEVASLADRLTQAREVAAQIGYAPDVDQNLGGVRGRANHLRAERGRMEKEGDRSRRTEREAAEAEAASGDAAARNERASRLKQQADSDLALARATLGEAHRAHAAAHLRSGLVAGQPCPVCRQDVGLLPGAEPVPLLEQLQAAVDQAEQGARAAAEEERSQVAAASASQATAAATRRPAEEARAALRVLAAAVDELERELQIAVAECVAGFPGQTIEARILTAAEAVSAQRQQHEKARRTVADLDLAIRLKSQEAESARNEVEHLDTTVAEGEEQLRHLEATRDRLREEIRAVTEADDPREEGKRIAAQITHLETALRQSSEAEAEAARLLEGARGKAEQLQTVAADADRDADTAAGHAGDAVRQAGFADAGSARAAALPPERIDTFQARIDGHRRALHAAQSRVTELAGELEGRRVSEPELAQAAQEHTARQERHQATQKEQAVVAEKLRSLGDKLTRAGELRRELGEVCGQHRVYRRLAGDLQSDSFQAFLLEEALGELVRGASQQLGRLTGDRYGLEYAEDQIVVIDRDNAGERRSTDTLSGGETFLASLSLALELSAQVQRAVGAIHLDCLFIDEGFGTLDPETLRVVVDAVRSLQVGGRMVGIITHIPELREEFDQRLLVEKESGASRVRIDTI
jgi:exonuclease SbcC